jgi:hypothetical protein
MPFFERGLAFHYLDDGDPPGRPFVFQHGLGATSPNPPASSRPHTGGGDEALKEAVSLWSADLVEVCATIERVAGSDGRPVTRYSLECVEGCFSEVRCRLR